jgi:hypothetical protein
MRESEKVDELPFRKQSLLDNLNTVRLFFSRRKLKQIFFNLQFKRLAVHLKVKIKNQRVAHSMLIAIYFVLKGNKFKELGADHYNNFHHDKKIKSHLKQLEEWHSTIR